MKESDCYSNWESELRYFMYRYEEHLAEEKGLDIGESKWKLIWGASAASSIEHISPQSPQSRTPVADKDALGNLMLLPPKLNSRLNNRPPKEKVDANRNSAGLFLATEVAAVIEEKRWSKRSDGYARKRYSSGRAMNGLTDELLLDGRGRSFLLDLRAPRRPGRRSVYRHADRFGDRRGGL